MWASKRKLTRLCACNEYTETLEDCDETAQTYVQYTSTVIIASRAVQYQVPGRALHNAALSYQ